MSHVGRHTNLLPMPAPETVVRRAIVADRVPIFRMLELYQHDLSDIWDQDLGADGEFGYELNRYWSSERCHSFVATVAAHYAGFALVDRSVKVGGAGYWMDQFFVMKKYRRGGVGSALAHGAFSALPGAWEVGEMLNNHGAQCFWRKVVSQYTAGAFLEHKILGGAWEGYVQCFESPEPE